MNFKLIAAAALLAGSVFSAQAATTYKGTAGVVDNSTDFDSTTVVYTAGTSFEDVYTFTVDTLTDVTGSAVIVTTNSSKYNLSGATLSLYEGTYVAGTSLSDYTEIGSSIDLSTSYSDLTARLASGDYFYVIEGTASGSINGKYDFTISASTVPEPANVALLLAGLGAFALVSKRRKIS